MKVRDNCSIVSGFQNYDKGGLTTDLPRVEYVRTPMAPAIHGPLGHSACFIALKPLGLRYIDSRTRIPKFFLTIAMGACSVSH